MIGVQEFLSAANNIESIVTKTPCHRNASLSAKYDANIFLKREDMQVVRSFKIRGAYHKIKKLGKEATSRGIICASAGNHAQGFAYACSTLSIKGTIYMPTTTPNQKISKVRHFGGDWVEIVLNGDTFDDSNRIARAISNDLEIPFIHPFDDPDIIAGQGTVGVEILDQVKVPIDYIIVAVGGGGIASGVGAYFHHMSPNTKIIAVEAEGAPSLAESLKQGQVITLSSIDSFADGIAVKRMGDHTFAICQQVIHDVILVPEGKICSTILKFYNEDAIVIEPAGAISIAALDLIREDIKGKNVVVIISGGNNDIARTEEIRERALLYEGRKHYFIIRFPQRAGALKEFLYLLGPNDDISHFEYTKKNNRDSGPALVGLELADANDFESLVQRMRDANINFEHINNNPMLFEMLV